MNGFLLRFLIVAFGLWLASELVPGIGVQGVGTLLGLVAWMFDNFSIAGFGAALLGSIVVSLTAWLASYFIGPRGRFEVIVVRRR